MNTLLMNPTKRKFVAVVLALAMIITMFAGVTGAANAADVPSAPVTVGPGDHITATGTYAIDASAANGSIYVDTAAPVTLTGNGIDPDEDKPNTALSIECTVDSAQLTLDDVWISEPFNGGCIIDFYSGANVLNSTDVNILDSDNYYNGANIHVNSRASLTVNGSPTAPAPDGGVAPGLYIYKNSQSAGIGGNNGEVNGAITFASGSVFVKGSSMGATIGSGGSASGTNGDISITGGQLSVETNAMGAGIGSGSGGDTAGTVNITGGSTLINVNFSGSAIGYGTGGSVGGILNIFGGSLKVVVDADAAPSWDFTPSPAESDTITNVAITARIIYNDSLGTQGDVAEVDVAPLLGTPANNPLVVTATPLGLHTDTLYNANGLNQNDFTPDMTYTPDNWTVNNSNTNLYLYLPISPTTGLIEAASDVTPPSPLEWSYVYNPQSPPDNSTNFTLTSTTIYTVTFAHPTSTVYVDGQAVDAVSVGLGSSVNFSVVPNTGQSISDVTIAPTSAAALVNDTGGVYTLSNVTGNLTATVATTSGATYGITFSGSNETVTLNGVPVTSAVITADGTASDTLNFTVTPDTDYAIASVTATGATLTQNADGTYALSAAADAVTVTITTTQTIFTVTFAAGSNSVAAINGVIVSSATVPEGGNLVFTADPYIGNVIASVTANGTTLTPDAQGNYTLSNVTANTTVTITDGVDTNAWTQFASTSTWAGSGTAAAPYQITNAADLARLINQVNGGNNYAGTYFQVTGTSAALDLSAHNWVPIGGGRQIVNGVPSSDALYFSGVFDGAGIQIPGLTINLSPSANGFGAFGLFGYVNEGILQNVSVAGTITVGASPNAVGGIVGYTTSSVYSSTNAVNIAVGNLSTGIGGIAGVVDNGGKGETSYISYCENNGQITGRSRIGGIAGAVYAAETGGAIVNQSINNGAVTASSGILSQAYVGGIVGYDEGLIQNCYNTGTISAATANVNFNIGGIAGILTGSPTAALSDSFNTGTVTSAGLLTAEPLYGDADNNSGVVISNCVYIGPPAQDVLGATWTTGTVNYVTAAAMATSSVIGGNYLSPTYFTANSPNPTLIWESLAITAIGPIYMDPAASTSGIGTLTNPVNTIAAAIALQNATGGAIRDTIYILSPVTYASGNTTITMTVPNARIVSGHGNLLGDLFTVNGTATLTITNAVIEGITVLANRPNTLIYVDNSAVFTLGDGGVLRNNYNTFQGGAIHMNSGTTNLNGGEITGNTANSGGAIYTNSGTLNINGTTISGNTAYTNGYSTAIGGAIEFEGTTLNVVSGTISNNTSEDNGGAINATYGTITISGGTIANNTAGSDGGALCLDGNNLSVTISGGTISGNSAAYGGAICVERSGVSLTMTAGTVSGNTASGFGPGIYVDGTFTLSPTSGAAFNFADVIYLPSGESISIGATIASITGSLTVEMATTAVGTLVAQSSGSYAFSNADLQKFAYAGGGHTFQRASSNTQITLAT